jgi:glucokinase
MFEFPVLLGDIGGTNARFAVLPAPREPAVPLPSTLTSLHASPVDGIGAALCGRNLLTPRSAFLAVATRVDGPAVRMTNASWMIDAAEIGRRFSLSEVVLVNDYIPIAAALTAFGADSRDLARLGPELPDGAGAKLVLGPGTGLGAAALLPFGQRFALQPTEAAHTDFGPSDAREMALWPRLERSDGRVTAETLLSGPGLLRLYRACAAAGGRDAMCSTPEAVTSAGIAGNDEPAVEALHLFARLLGRFAGDLVLVFGATGGVFIGGGIAPTIVEVLRAGQFRASFEDKAPYSELMRQIPTWAILQPVPAFAGLSAIASNPDRFLFTRETWLSMPL